jgi:hypothetical protein
MGRNSRSTNVFLMPHVDNHTVFNDSSPSGNARLSDRAAIKREEERVSIDAARRQRTISVTTRNQELFATVHVLASSVIGPLQSFLLLSAVIVSFIPEKNR